MMATTPLRRIDQIGPERDSTGGDSGPSGGCRVGQVGIQWNRFIEK
jgi:hypothetical protein